jgi:hypothetical protein
VQAVCAPQILPLFTEGIGQAGAKNAPFRHYPIVKQGETKSKR